MSSLPSCKLTTCKLAPLTKTRRLASGDTVAVETPSDGNDQWLIILPLAASSTRTSLWPLLRFTPVRTMHLAEMQATETDSFSSPERHNSLPSNVRSITP